MNAAFLTSRLLLAAAFLAGTANASAAQRAALPDACKLLTRAEAAAVAGVRMQPPRDYVTNCGYAGYPTGPTAQVLIYIGTTVPNSLLIDRKLGNKFRTVPHLGDQAFEEEWHIFIRKGSVWVDISLVRLEPWALYRKKLEHAAALAISRVRSKPATKRAARRGNTAPPPPVKAAASGPVRNAHWTGSELRYGGNITQAKGVVFQPDAVVIGGGASAVRSASADGLTWTIRGSAPGASDLRVGKIMVATTFATGRVLAITKVGSDERVVLGPVALTDVIRDGDFRSSAPIPLAHPLFYTTTLTAPKKRRTQGISTGPPAPPSLPAPVTTPPQVSQGMFTADPICCAGEVGVYFHYNNGSTGALVGRVELYLKRPTISFHIRIGLGKLIDAYLQVHGAGGLRYHLRGVTKNVSGNVVSGPLWPGSITIPLGDGLAITLVQAFDVSMQLSGAADFTADGDYTITGDLSFGFRNGQPHADAVAMATHKALVENTHSDSLGVNKIDLGWSLRASVGVGLAEFSAGVWYKLIPAFSLVFDGSAMGLRQGCATDSLDVASRFGVGFTIPDYVRSVVNAILSVVQVKPIPADIGPSWGPFTVWKPSEEKYCIPRTTKPHA